MEELLVIGIFIALVVHAPGLLRFIERRKLLEIVRAAVDKNQPLPDELLESLRPPRGRIGFSPGNAPGAQNMGVVLMCLGVGVALLGGVVSYGMLITGDEDGIFAGWVISAGAGVGFMLGLGLFIVGRMRIKDSD